MQKLSRRAIFKSGLTCALLPAIALLPDTLQAAALPPLDPNDATAKALGFVDDAGKLNAAAHPSYKPNQRCGTCAQYQGKASDARAACTLFDGRSVPQAGWCQVWAQRS